MAFLLIPKTVCGNKVKFTPIRVFSSLSLLLKSMARGILLGIFSRIFFVHSISSVVKIAMLHYKLISMYVLQSKIPWAYFYSLYKQLLIEYFFEIIKHTKTIYIWRYFVQFLSYVVFKQWNWFSKVAAVSNIWH